MPVTDRVARIVRGAGAMAGVKLQPSHDFMQGVIFANGMGEVSIHPIQRVGSTLLKIFCDPTASRKETWAVEFTLYAPGAHEALLAALRTICWAPLLEADRVPNAHGDAQGILGQRPGY